MKTEICPKCNSMEVHDVTAVMNSLQMTYWGWLGSIAFKQYVCANCGYVEHYVNEQSDLDKIRNKCPKVATATDDK